MVLNRRWDLVVVIERNSICFSWKQISKVMHGWLDKEVKIFLYLNNRVFMECDGKEDILRLLRVGKFVIDKRMELVFSS